MSDEHEPKSVEQQPSAPATTEEEKPKDTRSFEERIAALKKPVPAPEPDQQKIQAQLAELKEKIQKCDKRLTEIKSALDRSNSSREGSKSESGKVLDQLKAVRVRIKDASQERENLYQQLRDLKSTKEAQQKHLQDLKKSLKYDDIHLVDEKVKELERRISYGQCADLKEEKKIMMEIKQLNQMKSLIAQYNVQKQSVGDDTEARTDLERRRADATAKLDAAKKEAVELEKALEAARGKQPSGGQSTNELWKEQKELYGQIKAHRAEINKVNTEFREEANKFRDFQRALQNYKYQLQKIQGEQRRAEWEAKKKEAEGAVDADAPSDDPLMGHPWADEILQCTDLEKVLTKFLPKEAKGEEKEEEKEKTWLKGAAGKMSGKADEDPFASLTVSKKGKAPKKSTTPSRIVLTPDTIASLDTIGVDIPTTSADVQGCLDKLKEKKAAFLEMTESDKKEAKAKRGGKGQARAAAGKTSELVVVEISCTAADRVSVSLQYPALSA